MCTKISGKILASFIVMFVALQSQAADVVTIETQSSKNNGKVVTSTNILTIDDEKMRIDYLGSNSEKTATTPYLLTLDGGKDWVLGDLVDNEFYCAKVDMDDFFSYLGDLLSRIDAFTNPKFFDTKVEVLLDEAGPEILGFKTRHLRIQTTAKVKAFLLVKKFEFGMVKVDDVWYTNDREVHPAKQRWIEALTHSGYEKLDMLSRGFRSKISGPILKQNTVLETTNYKKNEVEKYTQNFRAVSHKELESSDIPSDTFSKPDCKKINKGQTKDAASSMFKEGKHKL